jgi:hypothetical protein
MNGKEIKKKTKSILFHAISVLDDFRQGTVSFLRLFCDQPDMRCAFRRFGIRSLPRAPNHSVTLSPSYVRTPNSFGLCVCDLLGEM